MTPQAYANFLEQLVSKLQFSVDKTWPVWQDITVLRNDFAQKMARWQQEGQRLSIGIIGRVKAGKSSFLNALLFNSQPLLPEAATPETANLTRISWGEQPTFTVRFFTESEWAQLECDAQGDDQVEENRAAQFLLKQAQSKQLDILSELSKGEVCITADSADQLIGYLQDYTSAHGRYTPLVKETQLTLPDPALIGLDIVDTPGMNDPVASRTQKTREYMAECDVVFFLSRSSQFLDRSDIDLLTRQLPTKGVKRIELIACQFDAGIDSCVMDCKSLAEAERVAWRSNQKRASQIMNELADRMEPLGEQHQRQVELLRGMANPKFVSTYAQAFAEWPQHEWRQGMLHVYQNWHRTFNQYFPDEKPYQQEDWLRIANFAEVRQVYDAVRADKEQLLEQQRQAYVPEAMGSMLSALQRLIENARVRISMLEKNDLEALKGKLHTCEQQLGRITHAVQQPLYKLKDEAEQQATGLRQQMTRFEKQFGSMQERTGTEYETRSYEVNTSTWYKPWTWGSTRTEYYTVSNSYQYLAMADAIENVKQFGRDAVAAAQQQFSSILSPDSLRRDLQKALLNELDTASAGFDPEDFRALLKSSLQRLEIPILKVQLPDMSSQIAAHFNGEVRSREDMHKLREQLTTALSVMNDQVRKGFNNAVRDLQTKLTELINGLERHFSHAIHSEFNALSKGLVEVGQSIKSLVRLVDDAETALQQLKQENVLS